MLRPPLAHSEQLAARLNAHAAVCEVVSVEPVSTSLSAVTLAGPAERLAGRAGNDVMVLVGEVGDHVIRRRYSVRALSEDGQTLTIWVTTGHDGDGSRWARDATRGDTVDVIGPRGKILVNPDADWHLFVGDVSSLGAFYRMAQSLTGPTQALFVVEIPDANDLVTPSLAESVAPTGVFVDRAERRGGDPTGVLEALSALELPEGHGQAYVFAEFSVVRAASAALVERGLQTDRIATKAFWRAGRPNAAHGEPVKND